MSTQMSWILTVSTLVEERTHRGPMYTTPPKLNIYPKKIAFSIGSIHFGAFIVA